MTAEAHERPAIEAKQRRGSVRLLHITTVPKSLMFLGGQVRHIKEHGFDVYALSSPGADLAGFGAAEGVETSAVEMQRRITLRGDLLAVTKIVREIKRIRPVIVHAHTPKGGLLGMIAATLARVPVRVYHMRGLPLMTAIGWRRRLLLATEWIACRLAHRVICVSHSLRDVAVENSLCAPDKITVLLGGSGNGVDARGRFDPGGLAPGTRAVVRRRYGIPDDAIVFGFVGRLVRDKGIIELASAWGRLREEYPDAHLLLVGPFEPQDPVPTEVETALRRDRRVFLTGDVTDTPPLFEAMDVVVLPTYREGFPNVPLEAAAMRRPVVATRIPGCVDAIVDGVTGLLVPPRDASALANALAAYARDEGLRRNHGAAARDRVVRSFQREALWEALHAEYRSLLVERGAADGHVRRATAGLTKRGMDILISAVALVLLIPVLVVVAVMVRGSLGRPILFRQTRPGKAGAPFVIYKFRTMRTQSESGGATATDAHRLTPLGNVLRRTSLDELPELWNVLRGDMSLVGPRPLLMEYLPLYTPAEARRHSVRPGLTGLAQISGRNSINWGEKFALDVWYVDNQSIRLDLRILLGTFKKVLSREGISHPGHVTIEPFHGSTS